MSVPTAPISINVADATQPRAGDSVVAQSGEQFVINDPNASNENPVVIIGASNADVFTVASGVAGSNVAITAESNTTIEIGTAFTINADGNATPLNGAGTSFQVDETFEGSAIVNLDGAIISDDAKVDLDTETWNGTTIADNAPAGAEGIDYYVNTGAGNDAIEGSRGNDFLRGGAGNDAINAGAGNDIVRPGAGTDDVTLGAGEDTLYLTVDQLQGETTNTITDFTAGEDTIQIDADLLSRTELNFVDGDLIIELTGSETGSTTVQSLNDDISEDDVEFV